jgi:STE24 endopeptidase
LIDQHTHDEILAVLAHEIGHWKLKHVLKSYLTGQLGLFAGFYMTYLLLNWDLLHRTFAISGSQPYLGLFVIGIFWQKAGYFFRPLAMAFSRRFEKQADRFAARLQRSAKHLATALKKMARHNLSNPSPHPFYVWFNYSHPPIPERIVRLEKISCDEKSR